MPTPSPSKKKQVRVLRPAGSPGQQLQAEAGLRPEGVPDTATLLVTWIDLPSDNEQRRGHWARHARWKEQALKDFAQCMNAQYHPGILERPRVHLQLHVLGVGDRINRHSRAKYLIDLLQRYVEKSNGKRHQGLLNLIENDDALDEVTCRVEEIRAKQVNTGETTRTGRPVYDAPCKALMWVWNAPEDT